MIKINLIPEQLRKTKGGLFDGGLGQFPREVIIGVIVAALGFLLCCHVLLLTFTFSRIAQQKFLATKWASMAADKKAVDEVLGEIKQTKARIVALMPIMAVKSVLWSGFVSDVASSLAKGVSLTSITLAKDALTISGTAVSRKKNEMLIAGNFVTALKSKPTFVQSFTDFKADYSIQSRDSLMPVAGFTVKAKLK